MPDRVSVRLRVQQQGLLGVPLAKLLDVADQRDAFAKARLVAFDAEVDLRSRLLLLLLHLVHALLYLLLSCRRFRLRGRRRLLLLGRVDNFRLIRPLEFGGLRHIHQFIYGVLVN